MPMTTLLNSKQVEEIASFSRAHLYNMMRHSDFPTPLKMSTGAVRWAEEEVVEWNRKSPELEETWVSDCKRCLGDQNDQEDEYL